MSGPTDHPSKQLLENLETLLQHNNVVLQWILAYVGTGGNDTADMLAEAESHLPQPDNSIYLQETKTLYIQN